MSRLDLQIVSLSLAAASLVACSSSTDRVGKGTGAEVATYEVVDSTCSSIVLVSATLSSGTDSPTGTVAIHATIDVAEDIAVTEAGLKVAVRAYNLDSGDGYVGFGSPLSPEGNWVRLAADQTFTPDNIPDGVTKVGPAPAGFQRLTFDVSADHSAFTNSAFDIKDIDFNRIRFDVIAYAVSSDGTMYMDRNTNHNTYDPLEKEIPNANISQTSAYGASSAIYCCSVPADERTCVHESYPPQ